MKKTQFEGLDSACHDDTEVKNGATGWVVIPSKIHDPENFDENVEKLKTLFRKNWCKKPFETEPNLEENDFHVYLEDGQPKLRVEFADSSIAEIRGPKNNGKIPFKYVDELVKHIKENELTLRPDIIDKIKDAEQIKQEVNKIKSDLKDAIENEDAKTIYEYFGMSPKETDDGFLSLSIYKPISHDYSFEDVGINEDSLFKNVKSIDGYANFKNSKIKSLGNLESIGGEAYFKNSQITDLGNLKSIGRNADFSGSQVTTLGNLEYIGRNAEFGDSQITDLGNLESIGGNAEFSKSQVKNLGNLKFIGGYADFRYSQVADLGNLESIVGNAEFEGSQITDLGNLESIGGDAGFSGSQVKNLGNLKYIGKNADFRYSQVTTLGNLEYIGRNADFSGSQITDLGNLKFIGGTAYFGDSKITSLGNLKSIYCAFIGNSLLSDDDIIKLKKICSGTVYSTSSHYE